MWTPLTPLYRAVGRLLETVDDSLDVWDPLYQEEGDGGWPEIPIAAA